MTNTECAIPERVNVLVEDHLFGHDDDEMPTHNDEKWNLTLRENMTDSREEDVLEEEAEEDTGLTADLLFFSGRISRCWEVYQGKY